MSPSAVSPRMVGREAELAALRAAFARSRLGEPVAVVVRGEAGIGKTLQEWVEAGRPRRSVR